MVFMSTQVPSLLTILSLLSQKVENNNKVVNVKGMTRKKKGVRGVGGDDETPVTPPSMFTAPSTELLRVTAFSTAESYESAQLLQLLQRNYVLLPYMADDVYHVLLVDPVSFSNSSQTIAQAAQQSSPAIQQMTTPNQEQSSQYSSLSSAGSGGMASAGITTSDIDQGPEAYIFTNGTFVTWNATEQHNVKLMKELKEVEFSPYSTVETEWFDYFYDMSQPGGVTSETIIIGHDLPPHQTKLAYSSGLARSVKLASLESQLDAHLNKNRHIPSILLQGKKLPFGRAAVLRNLGELFALRGAVNLHTGSDTALLDSPDFCWSSSRMESYFERISRGLDVKPRIAVFNKKLDYANELAEVLRTHLHEQHSLKLEWCIIILISVEICFELIHYAERLGWVNLSILKKKSSTPSPEGENRVTSFKRAD